MASVSLAGRLRTWIWLLIYGGTVTLGIGLVARRSDDTLGWTLAGAGGAAILLGLAMIWFRSRLGDNEKA